MVIVCREQHVYEVLDIERYQSHGPSLLHSLWEFPRVLAEAGTFVSTYPLLRTAPRGDGHPVLVLPGFTAGDESTLLLRRYLSAQGYRALGWRLGRNTGSAKLQDRLARRFMRLLVAYDGKLSLVGQSLGGVFARELARQFPDRVRQVITLGSPFGAAQHGSNVNPLVSRLFQRLSGMSVDDMRDRIGDEDARAPIPTPSTAIYSKSDGVVHWSTCLEYHSDHAENVEIIGSHSGMAMHPVSAYVIADRLAQPDGQWQPFTPPAGLKGLLLPTPASPGTPPDHAGLSGL